MYIPLLIKTDYSLLKSKIKLKDMLNINSSFGVVDDNLGYVQEYYNLCRNHDLKPLVGMDILYNDKHLYLFAKNYNGFLNLVKLNNLDHELSLIDLEINNDDLVCLILFNDKDLFNDLAKIFKDLYIGYRTEYEKTNALIMTENIVYANLTLCLKESELEDLKYLEAISKGILLDDVSSYPNCYLFPENKLTKDDIERTLSFANLFDFELKMDKRYIPCVPNNLNLLTSLIKKGINKRLNNEVPKEYIDRIKYELSVIKEMGYVDYFLIVYDYVLFAKKNNILVGPGRGSAAGSLISYALGITDVDPIKYNLLFERFLNKERITMPDIDIDFEFDKRDLVIEYLKEKYGNEHVALIMTYGTLGSKQVIRDVGRVLDTPLKKIDRLCSLIYAKETLKENLTKDNVRILLNTDEELKKVYQKSMALEGLKRHVSTHAAGVVICSEDLTELIPVIKSGDNYLTGWTMEYLEEVGLLKMDLLALRNLSIISNVLELIKKNLNTKIDLSKIPLDDKKTLSLFYEVDTVGIFQFESAGMKNFLKKLKVNSFMDLVNALALFRPGPMSNIDSFIRRREGREKIDYLDPSLKSILERTYGIIVYQEQVIEILNKMASYTYAEADLVRRAMSKKKQDVLENERKHFISGSMKNGYSEELSNKVFDYIMKFANYGFNKAHSVSYALIGYWMAYLKSNYPNYYLANLLNMHIGSEIKTKEYVMEAKKRGLKVLGPDINKSSLKYKIIPEGIIMPLGVIKNIGASVSEVIVKERENGPFLNFLDFSARIYGNNISTKTIEILIKAGVFKSFNETKQTLIEGLKDVLDYAALTHDLEASLVLPPELKRFEEYPISELMQMELDAFGFYISNHPSSTYIKDIVKSQQLKNYFDKYIKAVVLIEKITKIKTKKGEEMAFLNTSDETGIIEWTVFPKRISLIKDLKKGSLVSIVGQVQKRMDKYQGIVSNLEIIK